MSFDLKKDGKRIIVICLASVIMAVNTKTFVRTGGLYPGGVMGLTILIQAVFENFFHITVPYTVVNLLLNMIPIYIGFRYIGKKFTLYSCLMIVLTGILTDAIPGYVITYDILLISIFGGIICGFVISLCLMMNATTGGTDFIAIFLSEKKGVDSWNIIMGVNVVIIMLAGLLFGWKQALYSIIFQYASTQVLHMLYQRYQKQTLFIVTNHAKDICKVIYDISGHGATILEGEGSYEHCERDIVYSVVSKEESKKVVRAVKKADEGAFVNAIRTEELFGRFYQKPTE
ncbi:MAG: YitT family protein [Bacillus sp. (in: Bacteria)]|nr:YitT family protein [Bacillus sp. (in: firmicutes)]MCM1427522.1 YitT family protein [Eubacterium sp.]